MWRANGNDLQMAVGDYGVKLPIALSGITVGQYDEMRVKIANQNSTVLELTFSNISGNSIDVELTAEQSAKLRVGNYVYSLDWYQNGSFMCNLIERALFKVVTKV